MQVRYLTQYLVTRPYRAPEIFLGILYMYFSLNGYIIIYYIIFFIYISITLIQKLCFII